PRLDVKQPKLAETVVAAHQEDRSGNPAIALRDPAAFAHRIVFGKEASRDFRNQAFEVKIPTVLTGVQHAVTVNYPADVARTGIAKDAGMVVRNRVHSSRSPRGR